MRLLALALVLLAPAAALPQVATDPSLAYDKLEAMVPMRDGVRLHTEIYVPKAAAAKLPILLTRTPYGTDPDARGYAAVLSRVGVRELLLDGYVFVVQDIRGRFRSEGEFQMLRPRRDTSDRRSVDEGTDAYDTVAWLVKNVRSNGRVGVLGSSYGGWLTVMAMLEHHPAVKAYSPQATPADDFLGDDDFHWGAFRLSNDFEYTATMETTRELSDFDWRSGDLFDFFLRLGPLSNVGPTHPVGKLPSWRRYVAHPTYDADWKRRALPPLLTEAPAPVLQISGWYDQEDLRGPQAIHQALARGEHPERAHLVVGPWRHSGWWRDDPGDRLGAISFGRPTLRELREEILVPFFACRLKDRCGAPLARAIVFQTGTNVWERLDRWPRSDTVERSLYLRAGGRLAFEPPEDDGDGAADAYVSDPAAPVPSAPRPIAPHYGKDGISDWWRTFLVADQRYLHARPDVLSWETEPLADDVVVSGAIAARLFVSTTGTDADFVAKLVDVHPDDAPEAALRGYQLPVAGEILRARFRRSFERPEPFVPGKVEEVTIDLLSRNHVFRKGHRIMVQVHSTWFPLYDRNPQTFVPSLFAAKASDFGRQTHTVHRSRRHPSRITFATTKAPVAAR